MFFLAFFSIAGVKEQSFLLCKKNERTGRFANGKPKDNKASLVYDLDIQFTETVPEG